MELENFVLNTLESIGNIDFSILGSFLGMVLVVFWLVIIGWVWIDATERTSKVSTKVIYTLLVVFLNIPGLIIYLIVRPSETIEEIYWADLERRYLKFETAELGDCPKCGEQMFPGFVFCSNCGYRIKKRCPECKVLVSKDHKYCEFCGFQLRDRAKPEEKYPDIKVMEDQISASKQRAAQTVESKRTRYKTRDSFVVSLGNTVIGLFTSAKDLVKNKIEEFKENRIEEKPVEKISFKQTSEKKQQHKRTSEKEENSQKKQKQQSQPQKPKKKKKKKKKR